MAQILNEHELVINVGSEKGVRQGMRFAVLAPTPIEVKDPESGNVLGEIDRDKVRVEATEVRERMAICSTYEKRTVGGGLGSLTAINEMLAPARTIRTTLKASDASFPTPLSEDESYVKVGDRVRQLPAPRAAD